MGSDVHVSFLVVIDEKGVISVYLKLASRLIRPSTLKIFLSFLPPASAIEVIESEPCVCVPHSHGRTV